MITRCPLCRRWWLRCLIGAMIGGLAWDVEHRDGYRREWGSADG